MGETHPGVLDLARAGFAAQLMHELHHLAQRGRAERFAFRQQSAARVHGHGRFREELRLLAGCAQPELLVREQFARRVGVLAFDDVEVVLADSRLFVRMVRGQ
jgi:hypothetical protein